AFKAGDACFSTRIVAPVVLIFHDRQMRCRVAGRGTFENLPCTGGAALRDFDEQLLSTFSFFGGRRSTFNLTLLQELVHLCECPRLKGELRAVPSVVQIICGHLSSFLFDEFAVSMVAIRSSAVARLSLVVFIAAAGRKRRQTAQ